MSLCLDSSQCPAADVLVIFSLLLVEHLGHSHILLATFEKVRGVCRFWIFAENV